MEAALKLAERGLFTVTRGNPRVGCLLVKDHRVVGRGWHRIDGEAHAEVNALQDAGDAAKGSTAYITLEPCCFEGRTAACTDVLAQHGVKRVVVGARDYHPRVSGNGIKRLKTLGLEVKVMGLPTPGDLNPGSYMRHRRKRPFVRIKTALSLDGRTALATGASKWITSEKARRDVQYWRARSGAIVTGIGTVLSDDPRMSVREAEYQGCAPWRVVLDSEGRFPATAAMLDGNAPVVVVCGRDAHGIDLPAKVDVWHELTPRVEVKSVLTRLAQEGVNEVLVEAGSKLVGSFVKEQLWDEMIVYVAPKFMGSDGQPMADIKVAEMAETFDATIASTTHIGPDIRIILRRDERGRQSQ